MQDKIKAAPTVVYPESDGTPMAETEYHRDIMIDFIQTSGGEERYLNPPFRYWKQEFSLAFF